MPTAALQIAHRVARPVLARLLRPIVTGVEHVPSTGGALLAVNHTSNLDNYLVSAVSPRPVAFVGKQDLATGVFGRFNLAMGMIPVDRGQGDASVIDEVARVVAAGDVVAVFPEGTRSPTGHLYRFRSGVARIAYAAGVPVVPVGLRGAHDVWPRGERPQLRRPGRGLLQVHFGAPLSPPDQPRGRARRMWTSRLRVDIAELSGQPTIDAFAEPNHDQG